MKPNCTSINKYLPLDKKVYKHNINSICKRLNVSIKDLDRDVDSKLLSDTWILMLKEQSLKMLLKMVLNGKQKECIVKKKFIKYY